MRLQGISRFFNVYEMRFLSPIRRNPMLYAAFIAPAMRGIVSMFV